MQHFHEIASYDARQLADHEQVREILELLAVASRGRLVSKQSLGGWGQTTFNARYELIKHSQLSKLSPASIGPPLGSTRDIPRAPGHTMAPKTQRGPWATQRHPRQNRGPQDIL